MTVSEDDFEDFEKKTEEEKKETLRRLYDKIQDADDPDGLLQRLGLSGEVTVRVLDEEGDEKQVEKKEFDTR